MWLRDYSPVGGEDHSTLSPLRDDPHDDVPHESPRHRVHPGRGLLYIVGMRVGGNYKSQARVFDAADMFKFLRPTNGRPHCYFVLKNNSECALGNQVVGPHGNNTRF